MASSRRTVARAARWAFPLVTFGTTLALQVVLPRLLQLQLSEAAYIAYVTVFAIVAYIGLADGGLQVAMLRDLSEAHGRGDLATYHAEALRARRALGTTALVAALISLALGGTAYTAAAAAWPDASSVSYKLAAAAVLVATSLHLGTGTFHTVMLFSSGRLLTGQVSALLVRVAPLVSLVLALVTTKDLTVGLFAHAGATMLVALARAAHAHVVLEAECGSVTPGVPLSPLRNVLATGLSIKAAHVLPTAAYPHLLAVNAPWLVPVAIPARTLANAARLIGQQFVQLLQVHVTRQMAGNLEARRRGLAIYGSVGTMLTGLHLVQVAAIAALAEWIFNLWLPVHAGEVHAYLPGMLAEQALVGAAMPTEVLFAATGRLARLGLIKVVGVVAGLLVLYHVLTISPRGALGWGLAVSAVPFFIMALVTDVAHATTRRARVVVFARYTCGLLGACTMAFYGLRPLLVAGFLLVCGVILLSGSVRTVWRLFTAPAANGDEMLRRAAR